MKNNNSLPVAIVTGGAKRIGREISCALANAGFDIVISYHTSGHEAKSVKKIIESIGRKCLLIKTDITKPEEIKKLIRFSYKEFKRIDVLVNNAAIFQKSNLQTTTEKIWDTTFATNLKSIFFTAKEIVPVFRKQGKGHIINIASVGGIEAWKNYLPYSIAKAGVIHLTKILAKEFAPCAQVNAIAPGIISFENEEGENISDKLKKKIPLHHFGTPDDISSLVVFLVTSGKYITGQTFIVDGGKSIQ